VTSSSEHETSTKPGQLMALDHGHNFVASQSWTFFGLLLFEIQIFTTSGLFEMNHNHKAAAATTKKRQQKQ